jgi:hypothetical protein
MYLQICSFYKAYTPVQLRQEIKKEFYRAPTSF